MIPLKETPCSPYVNELNTQGLRSLYDFTIQGIDETRIGILAGDPRQRQHADHPQRKRQRVALADTEPG